MWWHQAWGEESMSNSHRPCCEASKRSSYNASTISRAQAGGARFAWLHTIRAGSRSLDFGLRGSGGNALQAAIALCKSVDVYGAGLVSKGALDDDKIYAHYYDHEGVGECTPATRRLPLLDPPQPKREIIDEWVRDRISADVYLHVLHQLKIIQWIQ